MIAWIASYPRSGNTFLRSLVASAFGADTLSVYPEDTKTVSELNLRRPSIQVSNGVNEKQIEKLRNQHALHFVKTHEIATTQQGADFCIYIIRDGQDATVSLKRHIQSTQNKTFSYIQLISGNPLGYTWSDHISSYKAHADPQKALYINFDELILSPHTCIDRISKLLNTQTAEFEVPTFSALHAINSISFPVGRNGHWCDHFDEMTHRYFAWKNHANYVHYCNEKSVDLSDPSNDVECRLLDIGLMQERHSEQIRDLLRQTHCNMEEIRKLQAQSAPAIENNSLGSRLLNALRLRNNRPQ